MTDHHHPPGRQATPDPPRWRKALTLLAGPVARLHRYRSLRNAAVAELVAGGRRAAGMHERQGGRPR